MTWHNDQAKSFELPSFSFIARIHPYPYAKTRTTAGHATPERSSKCRCLSLPLRPCSCRTVKAVFVRNAKVEFKAMAVAHTVPLESADRGPTNSHVGLSA